MRALKIVDGQSKGLIDRMALMDILLDFKRNYFRVGGDITVDLRVRAL